MESFDLWALKERYKSELTQLYDVWRIYIAWYTVFLSFNVAALLFYKQLNDAPSPSVARRVLIGVFFVVQNGCAIVTSLLIARFSSRAYVAMDVLLIELSRVMPGPSSALDLLTKKHPLIPRRLMVLGAWFNVTGPGTLLIIWFLLTVSGAPASTSGPLQGTPRSPAASSP